MVDVIAFVYVVDENHKLFDYDFGRCYCHGGRWNGHSICHNYDVVWSKWTPKEWHEYGKSISYSETETVCDIENGQKVNQHFEVYGVKYQFDVNPVDDLSLHDT